MDRFDQEAKTGCAGLWWTDSDNIDHYAISAWGRKLYAEGLAEGEEKLKEERAGRALAASDWLSERKRRVEAEAKLAACSGSLVRETQVRADLEEQNAALTAENKRMRELLAEAGDGCDCLWPNGASADCRGTCLPARARKALSPESEKPAPDGEGRRMP